MAGFVDATRSHVLVAPHLSWRNEPLREAISSRLRLPVVDLVVLEGVVIAVLVLVGLRKAVFNAIPLELKTAISVGIGLFIALIGLVDAGFVRRTDAGPVPVQLGGTTGQVATGVDRYVQARVPAASVAVRVRAPYVSTAITSLPTTESAWSTAFSKVLSELASLRLMEQEDALRVLHPWVECLRQPLRASLNDADE